MAEADGLQVAWDRELEEGMLADVTFHIARDGRDFRVNRVPLAVASPVFKAMLFRSEGSCWKELRDEAKILLEDISSHVFEQVVRFAYRVQLELTPENVMQVQQAADKYLIGPLVTICHGRIQAWLREEHPDTVLGLANSRMITGADTEGLIPLIKRRAHAMLKSPVFQTLNSKTICWLLSNEVLGKEVECTEDEVWDACHGWAMKQAEDQGCSWQQVLRPIRFYIRFPDISQQRLDTEIIKSGLLTSEEEVNVLLHGRGTVQLQDYPGPRVLSPFLFDGASLSNDASISKGGTLVTFNSQTSHRCVFAVPGFSYGTHSWTITWERCGCCGFVGVASAEEVSRGPVSGGKERFLGGQALAALSNSGRLEIRKHPGARLAITVSLDTQKVIVRTQAGEVLEQDFPYKGIFHPAIDSDENNAFSIARGVHL